MKKILLTIATITLLSTYSFAQTKKDGTPDMRYKANKEIYGNVSPSPRNTSPKTSTPSSSTPIYTQPTQERNYNNGGQIKSQKGYFKKNGTYVEPHLKTTPDNSKLNNRSVLDPKWNCF